MATTFTLSPADFRLFQRAIGVRFRRKHGRLTVPFFLQMFAWFCIALAAAAFLKIWQQNPEAARPFLGLGVLLLVGVVATSLVPFAAQRAFAKHATAPNGAFLKPQTIIMADGSLVLASMDTRSEVPWTAVLDRVEDYRNHYLFLDTAHAVVVPKTVGVSLGTEFATRLRNIESVA